MGIKKGWDCPNCNYTVVSSGGKDCGFEVFTQTFQCNICKELLDVVVSESEWKTEQWETHYCEKCNNLLKLWDTKKETCPNCGNERLVCGSKGISILWD